LKRAVLVAAIMLLCCGVNAQQCVELGVGEYFLGLSAGHGSMMPIGDRTFTVGLGGDINGNLTSPLMVSTTGRYVFGKEPLIVQSSKRSMVIPQDCELRYSGNTLRKAFLSAMSDNMKPDSIVPPEEFFSAPIYNTWSALGADLSDATIREYVEGIISRGFKPGILIIDNGWQSHNGAYDFDPVRFPDPKELLFFLHSKRFKVMLQLTPMVSPDCLDFKKFKDEGRLEVAAESSLPRIDEWYGGFSAALDMSMPDNIEYVRTRLGVLSEKYGIDGFKFDFVMNEGYKSPQDYMSHLMPWTKLASEYKYHLILGSYKSAGETLIGQLNYRKPVWGSLPLMLAEAINAGLAGYPFIVPDPVGGGFVLSETAEKVDPELYVRMAQMQAFFPSMQFSAPSVGILSDAQKKLVKEAVQLHEELSPYIMELAKDAAATGEPIIHSMEYNFPGKGFYDCNDQFMLGSRYLVAPVLNADGNRTVRLPIGVWIDDAGKRYKGPAIVKLKVPIDRILYFRAAKDVKIN